MTSRVIWEWINNKNEQLAQWFRSTSYTSYAIPDTVCLFTVVWVSMGTHRAILNNKFRLHRFNTIMEIYEKSERVSKATLKCSWRIGDPFCGGRALTPLRHATPGPTPRLSPWFTDCYIAARVFCMLLSLLLLQLLYLLYSSSERISQLFTTSTTATVSSSGCHNTSPMMRWDSNQLT